MKDPNYDAMETHKFYNKKKNIEKLFDVKFMLVGNNYDGGKEIHKNYLEMKEVRNISE